MTMAFSVSFAAHKAQQQSRLYMSSVQHEQQQQEQQQDQEEEAIACFIVNFFEVEEEGAEPHVVCTSQPDEYAWFNGIERHYMVETDGMLEGALECVEGASPRGFPEWECKTTHEESSWQ